MQPVTIEKAAPPDQGGSGFAEHTKGLTLRLYRKLKRAATKLAAEVPPARSTSAASPVKSLLGASPTELSHTPESVASSVGCGNDVRKTGLSGLRASDVAADGGGGGA